MEQGNSNKIDAIIDEIVKNNSIFKLKSPIEQEKEKASMAKSINSALSVLNEEGKEIVLQELSIDPDEKFKGFIDNVGNIDISGITKYTATIVKVKIEEAEREGIDLRKDSIRTTNDVKALSKDGILTIAALDSMVNNFNNLSKDERREVVNNWSRLTRAQQAEVMGNYADRVQEGSKKLKDESDRELAENLSKLLKRNSDELKLDEKQDLTEEHKIQRSQQYIEYIQNAYPLLYKEFLQYLKEKDESISGKDVLEIVDKFETFRKQKIVVLAEKMGEETERIESGEQTKLSQELHEDVKQVNEIDDAYTAIMEGKSIESLRDARQVNVEEENFNVEQNGINVIGVSVIDGQSENNIQRERNSQEVKQNLFEKLTEITEEPLKEALRIYSKTLKSFDEEEIAAFKCIDDEQERYSALLDFFVEDGIDYQMAEILSKIDYNGNLFEILGDPEKREQFFEELDKTIEQIKGPEVANEAPNQDVSDTQPLPEEVAAELRAIPVALQRINCQPEDIAKGMESYKQIIEGLSSEEIEGTQGNITEILQKEVEELGLDGVAGDILKMMSQITFNGQLSEILKNSKDAFLTSLSGPLLDPRVYAGNPEQNNSNSSNSSSLTEKVDEDTLKAGFEALAVDLQIADATIIRPEELVTDENAQLENGQEENTEFTKKEDRKENAEGAVISKLQAFFGVYRNAGMIEVQEVGEEIKEIVQELDLNLQNNNVHRVEEEIKNDEGIEQK